MKVTYDPVVDALKITLSNVPIAESDEQSPGVILHYDQWGNVVLIKHAFRQFGVFLSEINPGNITFD